MSKKGLAFIAKNTMILYVRMLFVMIITLYTVRVVLNILGVVDYGIYDVVAGVVTTMSFLSAVISMAIQRFYSYALGKNENIKLKQIFSISLVFFLIISIFALVVGESIGLWFLNTQLTIPDSRMIAANWIFQFALFSFIANIISIPFSSAIIAHEHLKTYSIINLSDYTLKLILILLLLPIAFMDKLIVYGFLMFISYFIVTLTYIYVSRINYEECHYEKIKDKDLIRDLLSYSGWTMYGTFSSVVNNQGNSILLNIFFGPVANAARSIAFQVSNSLSVFSSNFFMAARPPLIKSYAEGNIKETMRIFYFSNKFTFYLLYLICLPLLLETEYILQLWLDKTTTQMVVFSQLILVYSLIVSLHNPITILIQAKGNVKKYFLIVESVTLLSFPFTYLVFKLGFGAQSSFWIMIVVFSFAHIFRLLVLHKEIEEFRLKDYLLKFAIQAITISIVSFILTFLVKGYIDSGLWQLLTVVLISSISTIVLAFTFGLDKNEKQLIKNYILSFI